MMSSGEDKDFTSKIGGKEEIETSTSNESEGSRIPTKASYLSLFVNSEKATDDKEQENKMERKKPPAKKDNLRYDSPAAMKLHSDVFNYLKNVNKFERKISDVESDHLFLRKIKKACKKNPDCLTLVSDNGHTLLIDILHFAFQGKHPTGEYYCNAQAANQKSKIGMNELAWFLIHDETEGRYGRLAYAKVLFLTADNNKYNPLTCILGAPGVEKQLLIHYFCHLQRLIDYAQQNRRSNFILPIEIKRLFTTVNIFNEYNVFHFINLKPDEKIRIEFYKIVIDFLLHNFKKSGIQFVKQLLDMENASGDKPKIFSGIDEYINSYPKRLERGDVYWSANYMDYLSEKAAEKTEIPESMDKKAEKETQKSEDKTKRGKELKESEDENKVKETQKPDDRKKAEEVEEEDEKKENAAIIIHREKEKVQGLEQRRKRRKSTYTKIRQDFEEKKNEANSTKKKKTKKNNNKITEKSDSNTKKRSIGKVNNQNLKTERTDNDPKDKVQSDVNLAVGTNSDYEGPPLDSDVSDCSSDDDTPTNCSRRITDCFTKVFGVNFHLGFFGQIQYQSDSSDNDDDNEPTVGKSNLHNN